MMTPVNGDTIKNGIRGLMKVETLVILGGLFGGGVLFYGKVNAGLTTLDQHENRIDSIEFKIADNVHRIADNEKFKGKLSETLENLDDSINDVKTQIQVQQQILNRIERKQDRMEERRR